MLQSKIRFFAIFLFILWTLNATNAQNDLNKKLLMGYQGWFLCKGDGSPINDWRHWFKNNNPDFKDATFDCWPDISEYSPEELYETKMLLPGGEHARLFSSYNEQTVLRHFRWMQDYGIYGVYLQRFLVETKSKEYFQIRNKVLESVLKGAKLYNRKIAIMYDISGAPESSLVDDIIDDWKYLVDHYKINESSNSLFQNGLPVVAIWGLGFSDRSGTFEQANKILDFFQKNPDKRYRAYLVGGVPTNWRTLTNDSKTDKQWADVYRRFNMISPWAVGRYGKNVEADKFKNEQIVPDLKETKALKIDYMPVIFPGFSWNNLTMGNSPKNFISRNGGEFFWHQAYNAMAAGAEFIYVAMFDEVDEGTAMFKIASSKSALPVCDKFLSLDADGYNLPSDWYLRLAGEAQKMLEGTIPLSDKMPLDKNAYVRKLD